MLSLQFASEAASTTLSPRRQWVLGTEGPSCSNGYPSREATFSFLRKVSVISVPYKPRTLYLEPICVFCVCHFPWERISW